jgi:small subunit ribosomal protein S2
MLDIDNKEKVIEMAQNGIFYGHKKTKTHPEMKKYIAGRRNEIELLDPQYSISSFNAALQKLKSIFEKGGIVLFVGVQPSAKEIIKSTAEELNCPYVDFRWLGGTLTNFPVIRKRVEYYEDLEKKQASGELSKYTKKEQLDFAKEIDKLKRKFNGLRKLTRIPDAIFVVDGVFHKTSVNEAKKMNIPVFGIIDSDDNPELFDYPIFANDHSKASIVWILKNLVAGLKG